MRLVWMTLTVYFPEAVLSVTWGWAWPAASRSGVSGNLLSMTLDDEARAQVVREWMRSPLKQTEFCAEKGISPRVLREWMRRFGAGDRPEARALAIIDEALEKLTALRASVVAEAEGRFGRGEDAPAEQPERHAELAQAPTTAASAGQVARPSPPRPQGRGGFDWSDGELEAVLAPEPVGQVPVTLPVPPLPTATAAPLPMPAPGVFMLG